MHWFFWFLISLVYLAIQIIISMKFATIAAEKGYDMTTHFWYCFLFGIIGVIIVAMLPDIRKRQDDENFRKALIQELRRIGNPSAPAGGHTTSTSPAGGHSSSRPTHEQTQTTSAAKAEQKTTTMPEARQKEVEAVEELQKKAAEQREKTAPISGSNPVDRMRQAAKQATSVPKSDSVDGDN